MTQHDSKRKGIFVVIDGRDGVGKSTATKLLEQTIPKNFGGATAKRYPSPVPGRTERLIRRMLIDGRAKKYPNLFQMLFTLNRVIFQETELQEALESHDVVLMDRWTASTWAYGTAEHCNPKVVQACLAVARKPDVEIILQGPSRRAKSEDSYEDDFMMQLQLMDLYEQWADGTFEVYYPSTTRVFHLDVSEKNIEEVQSAIVHILSLVELDLPD